MKLKSKKSALLLSFTSLLLCFAMLAGSTFAWFTDTATTGVNKIVAGNLKVDIIGETGDAHLDTLNFTKAGATEAEAQILWEPGCRYLTEGFRIANKGNLALKWKAEINKDNIKNGKADSEETPSKSLLDVIDFYVVTSTAENAEAVKIEDFVGHLTKETTSDETYYIKGHMQEEAGNDYQNLTLEGITITVYATQDTVEYDSFDDQYDKYAQYGERTIKNEALVKATEGQYAGVYGLVNSHPDNVNTKNITYSIPNGNYDGGFYAQHFGINSTFDGNGATFTGRFELNCGYVPTTEKSTLVVSNLNVEGDLIITASSNNVIINNCTAKDISVLGIKDDTKVIIDGCTISGIGSATSSGNDRYGIYITRSTEGGTADVVIINSKLSNISSHAISVNANKSATNFTISGNNFESYGLYNETNRAAFKIWGDSKLDPTVEGEEKVLNEAAKTLAAEIKKNNTFATDLGENCVVADFFGKSVSFTD